MFFFNQKITQKCMIKIRLCDNYPLNCRICFEGKVEMYNHY
jgi:hypothetical protein